MGLTGCVKQTDHNFSFASLKEASALAAELSAAFIFIAEEQ